MNILVISLRNSGNEWSPRVPVYFHLPRFAFSTQQRMYLTITDVDDGSTVTDFLPAERARGVTIQSAAVSFHWPPLDNDVALRSPTTANLTPHNINLIDTPGHADFTFEVLRSLRILDGAVCILDGVAGVEAQTEKVWYQAAKYHIPKIIYVNKLDRDGAAFRETVKQIASRLHSYPAVCQIPWWENGKGRFCGIGDAIDMRAVRWADEGDGTNLEVLSFESLKAIDGNLHSEISKARNALVEILAEHDDQMVEKYLDANEDSNAIPSADIIASLRRCVLAPGANIVPVFAGASFKNIGVQTLLDAVVQLLPCPTEAPDPEISLGTIEGTLSQLLSGRLIPANSASKSATSVANFSKPSTALIENLGGCALAFKVVHDPRRGALVYIRTYSGSIQRQSLLFNTNLQMSERAPQLLKMYASDSVQVDAIPAGQIGVIPGLKFTRTGDTLISCKGANPKSGPPAPLNTLQLRPIEVPPAVFFASIEPHSLSEEKATRTALDFLVREDPSLQVYEDEESDQTLLSGMGEFHLEIAQDRLIKDLKAKASMGDIEIAYRESILAASPSSTYTFDQGHGQGAKQGRASCTASVSPLTINDTDHQHDFDPDNGFTSLEEGNRITISLLPSSESPESDSPHILPPHLTLPTLFSALKNGALAALGRGIIHNFRMHNTHLHISLSPSTDLFGAETTPAALSSAARLATKQALKATATAHGAALLELVMNITVSVDDASLGPVVNDLSSNRGGHILSLDDGSVTSGSTINDPALVFDTATATASSTKHTANTNNNDDPFPRIDPRKIYAPPDPFGSGGGPNQGIANDEGNNNNNSSRQRSISAKVPLKEMVGYLKHLRSLTGGRGTFVMAADRFERVVGQRERVLLRELRGGVL